jgi:hypothetical protein
MSKAEDKPKKFIQEHTNEQGKLISRWHYDLTKFRNGPILCENFDLPPKEKKSKQK